MTKTQKIVAGVVVVIILGLVYISAHKGHLAGNISPAGNPSSNFTYVSVSDLMSIGGDYGSNSIATKVITTPCNTASSTLFATANPFNATSTVEIQSVVGTGQATSSSLLIGTSTTSTGLIASGVSASLVNSNTAIATNTQYYITSGGNNFLGTGQVSSGANSTSKIVVAPSEFVSGFSTSTAVNSGAANYVAGQVCQVKEQWKI